MKLLKYILITFCLSFFTPLLTYAAIDSVTFDANTVTFGTSGNTSTVWCGWNQVGLPAGATGALGAEAGDPIVADASLFGSYYVPPLTNGFYTVREWINGAGYTGCNGTNWTDEYEFQWLDGLIPLEPGIYPSFPSEGQIGISYLTSFSGSYVYTGLEKPNQIIFHIASTSGQPDVDFDVERSILTDIDSLWGGGLTCENCPPPDVSNVYTYEIALESEKVYTYSVDLVEDGVVLYSSPVITFTTANFGSIDDPTEFINNGLNCDNCGSLQGTPSLMQSFFPFNIIWQLKSAMVSGLASVGDEPVGDVGIDFLGSELTVFSMSTVEDTINGPASTVVSDLIKGILTAGLYLAFGYMVYSSAMGVIKGMRA